VVKSHRNSLAWWNRTCTNSFEERARQEHRAEPHRYQHSAGTLVILPCPYCASIIAFVAGEYPVLTVEAVANASMRRTTAERCRRRSASAPRITLTSLDRHEVSSQLSLAGIAPRVTGCIPSLENEIPQVLAGPRVFVSHVTEDVGNS
jgi:hypothetical protein